MDSRTSDFWNKGESCSRYLQINLQMLARYFSCCAMFSFVQTSTFLLFRDKISLFGSGLFQTCGSPAPFQPFQMLVLLVWDKGFGFKFHLILQIHFLKIAPEILWTSKSGP